LTALQWYTARTTRIHQTALHSPHHPHSPDSTARDLQSPDSTAATVSPPASRRGPPRLPGCRLALLAATAPASPQRVRARLSDVMRRRARYRSTQQRERSLLVATIPTMRLIFSRCRPSSPPPLHQVAKESLEVVNGSLIHCTASCHSQSEMSTWRQQ
jgi:hypothetical protein